MRYPSERSFFWRYPAANMERAEISASRADFPETVRIKKPRCTDTGEETRLLGG
jgi:hypothetical protein